MLYWCVILSIFSTQSNIANTNDVRAGTLVIGINPAIGSQEELQSFSTQDATVSEEISLVQPEEKQQSEDSLPSSDNAPADTNEQRTKVSKKRGRIRELEEIKAQLAQKELELMSKENALLEKEQSMLVLRQELEIERNLRALITKEKEQAEEEAALAMGLCLL